jgi:hypothetical protein
MSQNRCGTIMAIGVSPILGWFPRLGIVFFSFSIQDCERAVGPSMGQPVTQIFLDMIGKKGPVVLMVNNVSSKYFI